MSGVLVVGDVIDDVVVRPDGPIAADTDTPSRIERTAGGSAAATACWLVAAGVPATLVATVGAQDVARHAVLLEASGVRPRLRGSSRPTGTIVVLSQGERRAMLTDRGANEDTAPDAVGSLDGFTHLHVAAHVLLQGGDRDAGWRSVLDRAATAGLTRSVAPGSAGLLAGYGAERFRALVRGVEVLPASADEAALLTGLRDPEEAAQALAVDHRVVAVTLGAAGAVLAAGGLVRRLPAEPADVVDVTGAGDAFTAGLLAGLLAGEQPLDAARIAIRLAADAVATVGSRPR